MYEWKHTSTTVNRRQARKMEKAAKILDMSVGKLARLELNWLEPNVLGPKSMQTGESIALERIINTNRTDNMVRVPVFLDDSTLEWVNEIRYCTTLRLCNLLRLANFYILPVTGQIKKSSLQRTLGLIDK